MQKQKHHHNQSHEPVLLREVLQLLNPKEGESYLDLTAGYGGHAREIINLTNNPKRAVLVDRDERALEALRDIEAQGAELIHSDFATVVEDMKGGKRRFDMVLIDLGVSSPQLDEAERGFSFQHDAPLDMRMDQSSGATAADLVNGLPRKSLMELLRTYSDEPKADRIADAIVKNRPVTTTLQLAEIIERTIRRRGKIHPATRTFQALRIAVNGELEQISRTLAALPDILEPGGRVAVISFHSLEDRAVKRFFFEESRAGYEARLKLLNKKPIKGASEAVHNPRSRSAVLRAGVKINTHERS